MSYHPSPLGWATILSLIIWAIFGVVALKLMSDADTHMRGVPPEHQERR